MGAEHTDPLRMERAMLDSGAELVRQAPPTGAASFSITVLTPTGWGYEPGRLAGLALVASELATAGVGRRDRVAVARELDRRGATLSSECHPESSEITLWGPAEQLDPLLPLLADALLRPRFDPKEIDRVRRQVIERQMRERTQPDRRAEKELFRRVYPSGHPYRETGLGTPTSVRGIDRTALRKFHRDRTLAAGSVVVATCRDPLDRILSKLDRAFGPWSGDAPDTPPLPREDRPRSAPVALEVPGGSQVEMRVGGPSITRSDPEYPAVRLANEVLGGRSILSRLFQDLREKQGLVYHAASSLEAMRWGGYWIAQAGSDVKKAPKVLKLLREEVGRLAREAVPASELDRVRESLIGSIGLELETTSSAHELATEVGYYHLPVDHYAELPGRLRAVTPEALREGAERGLNLARSATVSAGPLRATSVGSIRP